MYLPHNVFKLCAHINAFQLAEYPLQISELVVHTTSLVRRGSISWTTEQQAGRGWELMKGGLLIKLFSGWLDTWRKRWHPNKTAAFLSYHSWFSRSDLFGWRVLRQISITLWLPHNCSQIFSTLLLSFWLFTNDYVTWELSLLCPYKHEIWGQRRCVHYSQTSTSAQNTQADIDSP